MNVNWDGLWTNIFGVAEWHGIAMGFWVGMMICAIVVVLMNIVYWFVFKKFDPVLHAEQVHEKVLHEREEIEREAAEREREVEREKEEYLKNDVLK